MYIAIEKQQFTYYKEGAREAAMTEIKIPRVNGKSLFFLYTPFLIW